jgi:ArsR family transcriptional regulator, lead/cadmium/zinc/bismuth-responsive transcriptional repressor
MLTRSRTHPDEEHPPRTRVRLPPRGQLEIAAAMFRAIGDAQRLRLLVRLAGGEACVSDLAEEEGEKITTVSARLKALHAARLVKRRREAKHVFYTLADQHVLPLVHNAIDHAAEGRTAVSTDSEDIKDDNR